MLPYRTRTIAIIWTMVFILFLVTLALQLAFLQRDVGPHGVASVQPVTMFLLKLLGGLLLVLPIYVLLSRVLQRRQRVQQGSGVMGGKPREQARAGVVIEAFHGVVQRLREKEQGLERLRSEAEARAQEIESYNENILRSVASGVISFNEDGIITTFNDAAGRILKLSPASAIGKSYAEIFGPRSRMTALLARCQRYGEVMTREQFELEWPAGSRIWLGVSTSLLKDRMGRLLGSTLVFSDLTEVKELQQQVELQERMTVLGEMSAGIAHEFRNFMGTILGAAKLIDKQLPAENAARESVRTILAVISDMDHIIKQFLNFSGRTELNLKPVTVEPWLRRVVEQILAKASQRAVQVEIVCFPGLPAVQMDEVLMRQALGNVVQNALEAMPAAGHLTVAARLSPALGNRPAVELCVTDTGSGIPPDRLEKIFLPFYTTKTKGTGLGLALVHKIVLLHNGRIYAESQEGKGTTFHIQLPVGLREDA